MFEKNLGSTGGKNEVFYNRPHQDKRDIYSQGVGKIQESGIGTVLA